ncbi:AAA family ATPase [Pseudonocardia sp. TRM90224]|uniref:AAA family ATPase n=1 Tax=Pseudonocardia sp. TRM90224 TaxID=2812678 RepID=UPI001E2F751A|nr:ATP-binding protein [Pseudonocardia sp. TRM90224]
MLWLIVGLPGAGKTSRAREIAQAHGALRLCPDDWAAPLLGTLHIGDLRDTLEGLLLDLGITALRAGAPVVVEFGLWSRDERTALRWLAAQAGVECHVEYLAVDEQEQRRRVRARALTGAGPDLTDAELAEGRMLFEEPKPDEVDGAPLDEPPPPHPDWGRWAADRWPGLRVGHA